MNNPKNSAPPKKALRPFRVAIPTADGSAVAERIPIKVPMQWDDDIGEWVLTREAEELIETTKARHMGLLLPHQLRALRERHGLTQKGIGELLRVGAKSWTRWETGRQRPSQSINLLLCALEHGLISPQQLMDLRAPGIDWSAQFRSNAQAGPENDPVVIDFYRARGAVDQHGDIQPMQVEV